METKQVETSTGATGDTTSDITQSGWGTPLTVTPPPPDQVYIVPSQ